MFLFFNGRPQLEREKMDGTIISKMKGKSFQGILNNKQEIVFAPICSFFGFDKK
jgi:hypothetical protein